MNYLENFKIRKEVLNVQSEITAYEKEVKITLPPFFKAFVLNYNTEIKMEDIFSIFLPKFDTMSSILYSYSAIDKDNVCFQKFFQISEIKEIMDRTYPISDDIWHNEVIAFGECAFQGYLLVGIGNHNRDKIFIEFATEEPRIRYLCENIFDFFRNYIIEVNDNSLPNNVKVEQLYRNWGEDFWRVREEA